MLSVAVAAAIVYFALRLFNKKDALSDAALMPFGAAATYAYTGTGFYYVDAAGAELRFYDIASMTTTSSFALGTTDVLLEANGDTAVIYTGTAAHIVGMDAPIETAGQIVSVRCGTAHIAVESANDGTKLHIYDRSGSMVDEIGFKGSALLSFGFSANAGAESLWTLSLDTSSTLPVSTLTIYSYSDAGPAMTGIITLQSQLADDIVFSPRSIFVAGTNQLMRFDRAVSSESYRLLTYGYRYADSSLGANKPLFMLLPRTSSGGAAAAGEAEAFTYSMVRLLGAAEGELSDEASALVQLEDGIHSIYVMGGKLLAFSGDTMYTYKATGELESQRALPVDRVVRVIKLSETRFLMQRGGSLYLVSL